MVRDISEINTCKNGCIYAKKMPTITNFKYAGELSEQPFLWRCTKIDQTVTIDSIFHKLGCASFDNTVAPISSNVVVSNEVVVNDVDTQAKAIAKDIVNEQAETLAKEINQKLDEIEASMQKSEPQVQQAPPVTAVPATVVVEQPIKEIVSNGVPVHQVIVDKVVKPAVVPVADVPKKKRGRPAKSETPPNPVTPQTVPPVTNNTVGES